MKKITYLIILIFTIFLKIEVNAATVSVSGPTTIYSGTQYIAEITVTPELGETIKSIEANTYLATIFIRSNELCKVDILSGFADLNQTFGDNSCTNYFKATNTNGLTTAAKLKYRFSLNYDIEGNGYLYINSIIVRDINDNILNINTPSINTNFIINTPALSNDPTIGSVYLNGSLTNVNETSEVANGVTRVELTCVGLKEGSSCVVANRDLVVGQNKITITVTAPDGVTTKTYYKYINKAAAPYVASSDNNLKSITLSSGSLSLNSNNNTYEVLLPSTVNYLKVTGAPNSDKATISYENREITLNEGETKTIIIKVTAENGAIKTYTINVTRSKTIATTKSNINTLKSITLSSGSITFNPGIYNYDISIPYESSSLSIGATATDTKATVTFTDSEITLNAGETKKVTIIVKAENGEIKNYNLNITKLNKSVTNNQEETPNASVSEETKEVLVTQSSKIITKEEIAKVIEEKKILTYEIKNESDKILYSVSIDGTNNKDFDKEINYAVTFSSKYEEEIKELIGDDSYINLNFAHEGDLPKNTLYRFYVGTKYEDGSKLWLYYFNDETKKLEKIYEKLIVKDGYVEFVLEHCSEYVLSTKAIKGAIDIWFYALGSLGLLMVILVIIGFKNKSMY